MTPDQVDCLRKYSESYYRERSQFSIKGAYLQIHITHNCLNNCSFCYLKQPIKEEQSFFQKDNINSMSITDVMGIATTFVEVSRQNGRRPTIDLIGGDPMLYPQLPTLLSALKKLNVPFGIKGNPHIITDEVVQMLGKSKLIRFQFSLDGTEKYHDQIRGYKGLFHQTISAYKKLNKAGITVMLRYTLSRNNLNQLTKLQEIIFRQSLGVYLSTVRMVDPDAKETMAEEKSIIEVYKKSLRLFSRHLCREGFTKQLAYGLIFKDHIFLPILHQMGILKDAFIKHALESAWHIRCSMFDHVYACDVDGCLKRCQKLPIVIGKATAATFKNLFKNSTPNVESNCIDESQHLLSFRSRCHNCFYTFLCYGCPAHERIFMGVNCPLWRNKDG